MAGAIAYDEIKNFLETGVAPVPVLDFDQIEPALEQGTAAFIALESLPGDEDVIGFGDPSAVCSRESGSLICHYFVPSPESSGIARSASDGIRDLMRLQNINGVRIDNVSTPDDEMLNNGLWTAAALILTYSRDFYSETPS